MGSVTAGPSQGIKGAWPPVLTRPPMAGRSVAIDYTSTWELLKSFAPLKDEVVAPNTTHLGGFAETTSSSSSSSTLSFFRFFLFSFNSEKKKKKKKNKKSKTASFQAYPMAALTD